MLLASAVAFALSAAPTPLPEALEYLRGRNEDAGVSGFSFTQYSAGQRPFVSVDEAHLRATASGESDVVGSLAMGSRVTVLEKSTGAQRLKDRVDAWYRVEAQVDGGTQAGYVFGNVLTPFAFERDFNRDGVGDVATVAMSADFQIRTRFKLGSKTGDATQSWVDTRPSGEGYLSRAGGGVAASVVAEKTAGLTLVKLESRPEACSDYSDTYVSNLGTPMTALSLTGLVDPPNNAQFELRFLPKQKAAVASWQITEEEEKPPRRRVDRYLLEGGEFVLQKVK